MTFDRLEPLPRLGHLIGELLAVEPDDTALTISQVTLDLPVELDLRPVGPAMSVGACPPTQRIETTILPVLHRLRVTFEAEEPKGGGRDAGYAS